MGDRFEEVLPGRSGELLLDVIVGGDVEIDQGLDQLLPGVAVLPLHHRPERLAHVGAVVGELLVYRLDRLIEGEDDILAVFFAVVVSVAPLSKDLDPLVVPVCSPGLERLPQQPTQPNLGLVALAPGHLEDPLPIGILEGA